ncbi:MAG: DUF2314 domain-containing protein [Spirochaetaceae bacterium]|nr:DUF2314 domain-containing protein [Spirochaetaceae bacterium]
MTRAFALFLGLVCAGCIKQASGADPTIHRSQDDEVLQAISLEAQETFPEFMEKLLNPASGERDFLVKCLFEADPGSGFSHELLWLEDIALEDGQYSGVAANTPYYISRIAIGDRVSFDAAGIGDWMYRRDGKIIGGRSIKYLIEQIPQSGWDPDIRRYYAMFD